MAQELLKRLKKPIKILLCSPFGGVNDKIEKDGKVLNDHVTVTYVTFGEYKKQLPLVQKMGYTYAEIVDSGEVNEQEVKEVFNSVYSVKKKSENSLDEIIAQNKLLKEQNEKLLTLLDGNGQTEKTEKELVCEKLDELGIEYDKRKSLESLKELLENN